MAATDTWSWLRGDFTVLGTRYLPTDAPRFPVDDRVCVACHEATAADPSFENHYHHLLASTDAPPELPCVACHLGHDVEVGHAPYISDSQLAPSCEACHVAMGGPSTPFAAER